MKKTSKKNSKPLKNIYADYNNKRVRLCEFSVTSQQADIIKPALERISEYHGGKVPAISEAILNEDKRVRRKVSKDGE